MTTVVAYGGGATRVTAADGRAVRVAAGQQVVLTGTEWPSIATSVAPAPSATKRRAGGDDAD